MKFQRKIKIQYTSRKGGSWEMGKLKMSVAKLERVLNYISEVGVFLGGLTSIEGVWFHAIRLPDGREWDCVNGWQ